MGRHERRDEPLEALFRVMRVDMPTLAANSQQVGFALCSAVLKGSM